MGCRAADGHGDLGEGRRYGACAGGPQGADEEKLMAASELAEAQMELLRIRAVRAEMLAAVDMASGVPQELGRLLALDRYERFAHTRRRRASSKL
jgi:hypothetical protein